MSATEQLRRTGQHVWIDDLSTRILDDGSLAGRRDECGVTGVTANPTIYEQAIVDGDYDDVLAEADGEPDDVFWQLAVDDIGRAADLFADAYASSGGATGFVSIELSPHLAHDTDGSIRQGTELFDRIDRPNVMIKVPGTPAGVGAIEELTARGVNVNVTLLFGLTQWQAAHAAYRRGLERRLDQGSSLDVSSVASFFLSRIDDRLADELPDDLRNRAAVLSAAAVAAEWRTSLDRDEWSRLADAGARPQQLLWASTSPKDDALDELYYVERLVAPDSVITLKPETLDALCERDELEVVRLDDLDATETMETISSVERAATPLVEIADELQDAGVEKFASSYDSLIETIERAQAGRDASA